MTFQAPRTVLEHKRNAASTFTCKACFTMACAKAYKIFYSTHLVKNSTKLCIPIYQSTHLYGGQNALQSVYQKIVNIRFCAFSCLYDSAIRRTAEGLPRYELQDYEELWESYDRTPVLAKAPSRSGEEYEDGDGKSASRIAMHIYCKCHTATYNTVPR